MRGKWCRRWGKIRGVLVSQMRSLTLVKAHQYTSNSGWSTNSQQFIYIEIPECQCSLNLIYEVQKGFGTPMMHGHYCYSATATTCHCFWGKMIEAAASAGNLSAAEDWFRPQGQRASLFAFAQETVGRIDRAPGSTSFHLHTPFTSIHFHSLPFVQDLVIFIFLALQAKCGTLRRRGWPA